MGIAIEWTFRAGEILTFAGTMIGGTGVALAFLYRRGGDDRQNGMILQKLTEDFGEMKTEFKAFGQALATVAVQEAKINLLMKWYDELRNGIGIVVRDGRDR